MSELGEMLIQSAQEALAYTADSDFTGHVFRSLIGQHSDLFPAG